MCLCFQEWEVVHLAWSKHRMSSPVSLTFFWDRFSHWTHSSPIWLCQLTGQQAPGPLLSLPHQCLDSRQVPLCPAFYLGIGDQNSGLHACMTSTLYQLNRLPSPNTVFDFCSADSKFISTYPSRVEEQLLFIQVTKLKFQVQSFSFKIHFKDYFYSIPI